MVRRTISSDERRELKRAAAATLSVLTLLTQAICHCQQDFARSRDS